MSKLKLTPINILGFSPELEEYYFEFPNVTHTTPGQSSMIANHKIKQSCLEMDRLRYVTFTIRTLTPFPVLSQI